MRTDDAFLWDIVESAKNIREFTQGKTFADLKDDRMFQSAVLHEVQLIGEAARGLSEKTKAENPDIPWDEIIGMRHRIVHEYFRVDLITLWQTIQFDIPDLIPRIEGLLPPEN
jgi:uncharacterized protein with HEPN domain